MSIIGVFVFPTSGHQFAVAINELDWMPERIPELIASEKVDFFTDRLSATMHARRKTFERRMPMFDWTWWKYHELIDPQYDDALMDRVDQVLNVYTMMYLNKRP